MSDIPFVQRTFTVGGVDVPCRFFRPVAWEKDFLCRYEIEWPERVRSLEVAGVDEVQALLLAMQAAHSDLLASREKDGKPVSWLGMRRLGLPVPEAIRDLDSDEAES